MAEFRLRRAFVRIGGRGRAAVASSLSYATGVAKNIAGSVGSRARSGLAATFNFLSGGSWVVPPITLPSVGSTSNVAATGPVATSGGFYDVDGSGAPLPTGMSISDAGLLTNSSAVNGTTPNVVFGYVEPNGLPTLTLHPSSTGTLPYMATVYPLEGVVPNGQLIVSPDDNSIGCSILSRWPDNSAQVAVIAGLTNFPNTSPRTIRLRVGTIAGTNLDPSRVSAAGLTDITVSVPLIGVASLTTFNAPAKTWWTNTRVICCRYYINIGADMQAVVDAHAFAGTNRVFVEIVIENGKLNPAAPVAPSSKSYTNGLVSVNQVPVQTLNNPVSTIVAGLPIYATQQHEAFRAVYCSTWVGGNPNVEVTHDATAMQWHPMFHKCARPSPYNYLTQNFGDFNGVSQPYANDLYSPWVYGRHRGANMGGTGDSPSIGTLTAWDARYIQSGDRYARRAVIASALALHSYNINFRNQSTLDVVNPDDIVTRFFGGSGPDGFPRTNTEPAFEQAHQPEVGLVAFLCRPSPCFIELAQKNALWNCAIYLNSNIYFQTRGRAWGMRNLGHAVFLTPDDQTTLKAGLRNAMGRNVTNVTNYFKNNAGNPLNLVVDSASPTVTTFQDHRSAGGFQQSIWQHHFCAVTFHKLANGKILRGSNQTLLNELADWACNQAVRYVTESTGGEWRFHRYESTIGTLDYGSFGNGSSMGQLATWGLMNAWWMNLEPPPSVSGPWKVNGNGDDPPDRAYSASTWLTDSVATTTINYVEHFWMAFVAGIERNLPNSDAAWTTVVNNLTGLSTWLNGFANDVRQGWYPRNKP